jgi:glycosyltransferase involved in cell wall biosynthesis
LNNYKIIIPVFNPDSEFIAFLAKLDIQNPNSLENTIIVDDGSTNGVIDQVADTYPGVRILKGDGNLWWGGAIRLGMEHALNAGTEVFIWLNSDCLPDIGAIRELADLALKPGVGAVGAWCYTQGAEKWGFNPGFVGFKAMPASDLENNELVEVDGLNGNFVALNADAVRLVGLPRTDLFPHYMDGPYTQLIGRKGFKLQVATRIRASLKRDLERSVRVMDYCAVWPVCYTTKLAFFFLSPKSTHHFRNKFHRMKSMRNLLFFFPFYVFSQAGIFLSVTIGHLVRIFIPSRILIDRLVSKYDQVAPSGLLRQALTKLSHRRT